MAADEKPKTGRAGGERRSGGDRRQGPPVTIDLKADKTDKPNKADDKPASSPAKAEAPAAAVKSAGEAGGAERPAMESSSPPPPPPPKSEAPRTRAAPPPAREGWTRIVVAGVVGGAAGLVLFIVLQATGLLPVPGGSEARQAIDQAQTASDAIAALDRRVMAVEAMTADLPSLRSDVDALGARIATLETDVKGLATANDLEAVKAEVADLGGRLGDVSGVASAQDLAALTTRVDRLEAAPAAGAAGADVASTALVGRVDDTEKTLAALTDRVAALEERLSASGSMVESENAARAIALTSLRRAAEGGDPFAADLDMAAAFGVAGESVDALRPYAANGVATEAELAAGFPAVADAILAATADGKPEGGFFAGLFDSVRGLVSIRPSGPMPGDDPPAIVSRMQAAVAGGDIADALAEREGLPEAGKQASAGWAKEATDRVAVDRLVAEIAGSSGAAGE
jgi:hypothetical protein